jgi:hypothetical protein
MNCHCNRVMEDIRKAYRGPQGCTNQLFGAREIGRNGDKTVKTMNGNDWARNESEKAPSRAWKGSRAWNVIEVHARKVRDMHGSCRVVWQRVCNTYHREMTLKECKECKMQRNTLALTTWQVKSRRCPTIATTKRECKTRNRRWQTLDRQTWLHGTDN